MQHKEATFHNIHSGNIYYQSWKPDGDSKAIMLIVHGLAEHSGRYMNFVNYFTELGYSIYALDHPGHGKSDGTRVYVDSFEDYISCVKQLYEITQTDYPDLDKIIVGHSMGGLIASYYLIQNPDDFKAAVISGPGVKVPENVSSLTVFLGKIFSKIAPKLGLLSLEAEAVCSDSKVVDAYIKDPLNFMGKVTARLAAEMLGAMNFVTEYAVKITLPMIIVHGASDRLVEPAAGQLLYDSISSEKKEIHIYDGFFHEVFNEPRHKDAMQNIQHFLEALAK